MGASKCPTRLLACRNAASSDDAFDDLEDQTVSVTNLDDELAPPRPSGAPAPEPQASTQVVPLTEDVPPEDGVVEVVQPNEERTVGLPDGNVILNISTSVQQPTFQLRLQLVGLESPPVQVDGDFIQTIALERFDPVGLGTLAVPPLGQVILALQVEAFDASGDPIQDLRFLKGIDIEIQLSDRDVEDLGGLGAIIVGHMLAGSRCSCSPRPRPEGPGGEYTPGWTSPTGPFTRPCLA